jgi:hypothetical protein
LTGHSLGPAIAVAYDAGGGLGPRSGFDGEETTPRRRGDGTDCIVAGWEAAGCVPSRKNSTAQKALAKERQSVSSVKAIAANSSIEKE